MFRKLAWGNSVGEVFRENLYEICQNFAWSEEHGSWIMSCMAFESGYTFSSEIRNAAGSGAVGLIQFMPATAAYLGTTPDELSMMSAVSQLKYVEKYFKPYASRIHNLADMYMAILLPKYVGKPDTVVLFQGGVGYRQNAGLDANRDGVVTKAEAASKVRQAYEKGLTEAHCWWA